MDCWLTLAIFLTVSSIQWGVEADQFTADSLKSVVKIIETVKSAEDISEAVHDLPPTLANKLISIFSKLEAKSDSVDNGISHKSIDSQEPRSVYDFVVDLTRPTDIYESLKAYPISFPLGKQAYDIKVKQEAKSKSRFMVNVVGRYNVGKTYVLRLIANVNLGHSFVERTNGISVALTAPRNKNDPYLALIDTAGSRTPVSYDPALFPTLAYERQVSDAFIQEIALNSSEIFIFVINQLTLDDQLYLKMLHKRFSDKHMKDREIKQRLLIVHNYFNLHTVEEVEKTAKYELGQLFGATQQTQGHWLSKDYKHFILANSESEAGKAYNNNTIDQLFTMIKASNAMLVDNVLEHIMYQIELLLTRFLEEKPVAHQEYSSGERSASIETQIRAHPDKQREVELSRKGQIRTELEIKGLSFEGLEAESLWFICPKHPFPDNVTLSKNLKFNEDGSVYIDYSSQFIPDILIAELNNFGDILISIECPACHQSSIKVSLRGTTLIIKGEKSNDVRNKEYLNTKRTGKFEIEVPVGRLNEERTFDFQKRTFDFQDGIISIVVPVLKESSQEIVEKEKPPKKGWFGFG